jgi:hypothetical protein
VAYLLQYDVVTVIPYLQSLDLSREGRVILAATLHNELRVHGDAYINDPARRLAPGSDCFRVDFLFRDPPRGVFHNLHLIIDAAGAQYGILRILFADDTVSPAGLG